MYVSGKGSIQLINTYKVIGRRLFYLTSSELAKQSYFTLTNEGNTLLATAQLSVISNKDFEQVKLINHTKTTTFVFYNNPFSLYFGLKLIEKVQSVKMNLRLKSNFELNSISYNFSNLVFNCFYTDKESFERFNNQTGNLTEQKIISIDYINKQPIINIEITDSSALKKYPYIILKIEEQTPTVNWTFSNMEFEISPYIEYDYNEIIYLTEKRYHYNKMTSFYQLYELQYLSNYCIIEFSSCSEQNYQFSFSYKDGKSIPTEEVHSTNEYGKTIL